MKLPIPKSKKTRRYIVIAFVIAIVTIVAGIFGKKYWKKYQAFKKTKIETDSFKITNQLSDVTKVLSGGFDARYKLKIGNFSNETLKIEQVSIDVFTTKDVLLANQVEPLKSPVDILPNQNNIITVNYNIKLSGMLDALKDVGITNAWDVLNKVMSGKLGIKLHLVGFVVAEGIKIPIDNLIDV